MKVFCDMPCSFVETERRFRGAYCLHYQVLTMVTVRITETSVYFNKTTQRFFPERYHLQICFSGLIPLYW
jgi:hypothetical protein